MPNQRKMLNYINQLYLGSVCETSLSGVTSTGVSGNANYDVNLPWDQLLSGGIIEGLTSYCSIYENGVVSGSFYNGYKSGVYTGLSTIQRYSGFESVFNSGYQYKNFSSGSKHSGDFSGLISLQNFSGIVEVNYSGTANFGITGNIYGFNLGTVEGTGTNVIFTGTTWSAISGVSQGNISGIGSYVLIGRGGVIYSNIFNSSGYINYNGTISGVGNFYNISGSGTDLFSGQRQIIRSGFWTGKTVGYRTGFCVDGEIRRNPRTTCGDFQPFRSVCGLPGTLDIRITEPPSGQVFKLPYLSGINSGTWPNNNTSVPIGSGVFPTGIYFTGILIHNTGDPNNPDDDDQDPDDDPNDDLKCPFYDVKHPSCESGNNGQVSFILQNNNPPECLIFPPYSGYVSKRASLDSVGEVIFTAAGTSEYPFPNLLTFDNVEESIYTLHLSGSSGYIELIAPVSAQGGVSSEVDIAILNKADNCFTSDGVVRFQWSGYLEYGILGTPYVGSSTTGFLATGLQAGEYTVNFSENQWCGAERLFNIQSENKPVVSISTTGIECTGNPNDGSALISISGGFPPYSVSWLYPNFVTGYTGLYRNDLTAEDYAIQIVDASGCLNYGQFEIGYRTNQLTASAFITTGSRLVCCQHSRESDVDLPVLKARPENGIPPYTYEWYIGENTFVASGVSITGYPGEYKCRVTDSVGCTAETNSIDVTTTNHCYKVKWSSELLNGGLYQEYIFIAEPGDLPTSVPFIYSVPGTYLVKLSIADGFGRVGIDCITIRIQGYTPITNPPPDLDTDNDGWPDVIDDDDDGDGLLDIIDGDDDGDGTPDEDDDDEGGVDPDEDDDDEDDPNDPPLPPGGGGGDDPDGDGDDGDGDDPNGRNVCCVLLNSGINDNECRTHCTADATFCKGKDQNSHKVSQCFGGGDCCDSCDNQWQPQKGACCICRLVEDGPEPYEECECFEISSCDPNNACKKEAIASGPDYYTHGFNSGKNCDETSPDYACPIGICCKGKVPNGELGDGCGPICVGRMTESACKRDWGSIIDRNALTCEAAGAIEWNGSWFCSFNPAMCCITASPSDSSSSCPCECLEDSSCKECAELIALKQSTSPQCNYAGGATPRDENTPVDQLPQCGVDCPCEGSSSGGVGGPT